MPNPAAFEDLFFKTLRQQGVLPGEEISEATLPQDEGFDLLKELSEVPGEVVRGVVRAGTETLSLPLRAASAIPGVNLLPAAKQIETLGGLIEPTDSLIESGIAVVGPSLIGGIALRAAASLPLLSRLLTRPVLTAAGTIARQPSTSRIAGTIAGLFGASEFASTQDELRQVNQTLPDSDKIPEDEITGAAIVSGVAEALLERIPLEGVLSGIFDKTGRSITERAASAIARRVGATGSKLLDYGSRVAGIAAVEIPQEAVTAAIQAGARQRVLEPRGVPTPTPGQAAAAAVGPTAISSLIFGIPGGGPRRFTPTGEYSDAIKPLEGGIPPEEGRPVEPPPGAPPPEPLIPPEEGGTYPPLPGDLETGETIPPATGYPQPGPPLPAEIGASHREAQEELQGRVDEMLAALDALPAQERQSVYTAFNLGQVLRTLQVPSASEETLRAASDTIDVALRAAASREVQLSRAFVSDQPQEAGAQTTQQLAGEQRTEEQRLSEAQEFALQAAQIFEERNYQGFDGVQLSRNIAQLYNIPLHQARQIVGQAISTGPTAERARLQEFERQEATPDVIQQLAESTVEPFLNERTSNQEIADLLRQEADARRLTLSPQQAMDAVVKAKRDLRRQRARANLPQTQLQSARNILDTVSFESPGQKGSFTRRYNVLLERVTAENAASDENLVRDTTLFLGEVGKLPGAEALRPRAQETLIEQSAYNPEHTQYENVLGEVRSDTNPEYANRLAAEVFQDDADRRDGEVPIEPTSASSKRLTEYSQALGLLVKKLPGTAGLIRLFKSVPEGWVMRRLKREAVAALDGAIIENGDRDVAALGGIIRDPRIESFVMIALNKLNRVVGVRVLSQRLAGSVAPWKTPYHQFDVVDRFTGTVWGRALTRDEAQEIKREIESASREQLDQMGYGDTPVNVTISASDAYHAGARFTEWKKWMQSVGGSKYYLMHNHPPGNPIPSGMTVEPEGDDLRIYTVKNVADVGITHDFNLNIPGFQGHVVVNHDTYAVMTIDQQTGELTGQVKYLSEVGRSQKYGGIRTRLTDPGFPEAQPGPEFFYQDFDEPGEIALLAADLVYEPEYVVMMYATGAGRVAKGTFIPLKGEPKKVNVINRQYSLMGVELVPAAFFTQSESMRRLLNAKQQEYGADTIISYYAGTQNTEQVTSVSRYLYEQGVLFDHVNNPTPDFKLFQSLQYSQQEGDPSAAIHGVIQPPVGSPARVTLQARQRGSQPLRTDVNRLSATMTEEEMAAIPETVERVVPTMIEGVRVDTANKNYRDYMTAYSFATDEDLHGAAFRKLRIGIKQLGDLGMKWLVEHLNVDPRDPADKRKETLGDFITLLQKNPRLIPDPVVAASLSFWNKLLLTDADVKHKEGLIDRDEWLKRRNVIIENDLVIPTVSQYGRGLGLLHRLGDKTSGVLRFEDIIKEIEKRMGSLGEARREEVRRQLEAAAAADEPHFALYQALETMEDQTTADVLWEVYYFNLLSGIPTHTTNTFATFAHILFHNAVVEPTAAVMDWAVSGIRGEARQRYIADTLPALGALFRSLPSSFAKAGAWWWRSGERGATLPALPSGMRASTIGRRLRSDVGSMSAWRNPPSHYKPWVQSFMRTMAPFVDSATRAMLAMDVANGTIAFQAALQKLARNDLRQRRPNASAAELRAFTKDVTENLHRYPDLQEAANAEAERLTFNDPAGRIAQIINGARKVPMAGVFVKLLMPFSNTPDRLISRGMEFIPVFGPIASMMLGTTEEQERLRGVVKWDGFLPRISKNLPPEVIELAAKQIIGTLITLGIMSYWDDDILTGPLSTDPGLRESQLRRGQIPYAFKKGDTYYEYRRFEPMNMVVGTVTSALTALDEYQERLERRGVPITEANVEDMTGMAALAVTNTMRFFIDSSYFSGVAGFFESLSRPGGITENLRRQLTSAVVPAGALLRNINRVAENEGWLEGTIPGRVISRQNRNLSESFRRGVPGLAQTVAPIPQVSGEPRSTLTSPFGGGAVEALVSPVRGGRPVNPEIENELARLRLYPRSPVKSALEKAVGRRINNNEFDRFVQLRNQLFFGELRQIMGGDSYYRLRDDRRRLRIERARAHATQQARRQMGLAARRRPPL